MGGVRGEHGLQIAEGGAGIEPGLPRLRRQDDGHPVDHAGDDGIGRGADDGEVVGIGA